MSGTRLSIVTACDPIRAAHLPAAAASVHATASAFAVAGLDLEWLLRVDGPGNLPRFTAGEHVFMRRLPVRNGLASCRNDALSSATGDWVMVLDADDVLHTQDLVALLGSLRNLSPRSAWISAASCTTEGAALTRPVPATVSILPGVLADTWVQGWPTDPVTALYRRDALVVAGGWPALAGMETEGALLRVSEEHAGLVVPHVVTRRRSWAGQVSKENGWAEQRSASAWQLAEMINKTRAVRWPQRGACSPAAR